MKKIDFPLTVEGKGQKNKISRRGKSFGYQILGFGSGGSAGPYVIPSILVVAGGGSGGVDGGGFTGGGGGGGGMRIASCIEVSPGVALTVTIGAGGSKSNAEHGSCQSGKPSNYSGCGVTTFQSAGGGGGGTHASVNGFDGGSGGGAGSGGSAGQGNTPSTTPSQGADGGAAGGGGGGGGAQGQTGHNSGCGGHGTADSITGSSVTYAGGGAGGNSSTKGNGTLGQGGHGKPGGSAGSSAGGNGSSGVVIFKIPTANYSGTTTGCPTVTTSGCFTIVQYEGSGSLTT